MEERGILEGRIAFVTGADRGLGASLAAALLARGCRVFAGRLSSNSGALEALAGRFADKLLIVPLDIASDESVARAARRAGEAADRIDILINNAAILGDIESRLGGSIDFPDILRVFDVNAVGPLRVTNALAGLLLAGDSRLVVNISSESGSIGLCSRDGWFAYYMSKSALNMQSALVHNDLRPRGGKVVVIHPGWMRTWMRGALDSAAPNSPDQSAEGIIAIIERAMSGDPAFSADRPAYLDFQGKPLPW
jgi:NAD(P)-dependent dehydrogenase (short-subunit alcohol dehydrogenase family)